jgi:hypothetical protein
MYLFVLFGDGAITRKENNGNFVLCTMHNDAVSRHFFSGETKNFKSFYIIEL